MKTNILISLFILISTISFGQVTVTHNTTLAVTSPSITCVSDGVTLTSIHENIFDLATDFGITEDWQILSVSWGINDANNLLNGEFPLEISAFTTDNGTPNGNLTFLGSATIFVTNNDDFSILSVDFPPGAIVPAGELLMLRAEAFGDGQSLFRFGMTNEPANEDSWGFAPPCGFAVSSTFLQAGFDNVWDVMSVVGDSPSSIEESYMETISVYPNPTKDILYFEHGIDVFDIQLFDMTGKQQDVDIINKSIDLSDYAHGLYILEILSSKGIHRKKIIKE